jgi:hypothetical protein
MSFARCGHRLDSGIPLYDTITKGKHKVKDPCKPVFLQSRHSSHQGILHLGEALYRILPQLRPIHEPGQPTADIPHLPDGNLLGFCDYYRRVPAHPKVPKNDWTTHIIHHLRRVMYTMLTIDLSTFYSYFWIFEIFWHSLDLTLITLGGVLINFKSRRWQVLSD